MIDALIQTCLAAARVPKTIPSGDYGPWMITRQSPRGLLDFAYIGRPGCVTMLSRLTERTMHLPLGEVVMEDSNRELLRHAPAWKAARGHVLVTGLGLGCVIRGLLVCPDVERVTVIEQCEHVIRAVSPSFIEDDRLRIIHGDALTWKPSPADAFDIAWHDIWSDEDAGEPSLHLQHGRLMMRFRDVAGHQGAWQFPRFTKRCYREAGFEYLRRA